MLPFVQALRLIGADRRSRERREPPLIEKGEIVAGWLIKQTDETRQARLVRLFAVRRDAPDRRRGIARPKRAVRLRASARGRAWTGFTRRLIRNRSCKRQSASHAWLARAAVKAVESRRNGLKAAENGPKIEAGRLAPRKARRPLIDELSCLDEMRRPSLAIASKRFRVNISRQFIHRRSKPRQTKGLFGLGEPRREYGSIRHFEAAKPITRVGPRQTRTVAAWS
jgi:hypothetical protein